ncbi:MAG: long-chain fatty acid--CoA ligase [Bacteroidetes bacterium GWE2_39_28]|nr:MAG: long-chain fatty acid--CoA ligase [Bacteroidetes bacterium GWE2_39_28]OFY15299.1 MAG: long-chain fatty acid--CoA ligase [Bacteroidetes bacterium GWF2_39_10]OFZ09205.1 MAG: long-chain fatty acid--CoA ligase [Bacteroidetes bacterium RIFOXYB2_FULL_39_7]OFZ11146.1 MAG: long-chain fatty acid--CoA ligase [Bacteroidetes bacterium RIFOXYC2_FULL_39_11]HCT93934.1 long-chain fatty acid--CoA ligase [Rikenellaceae bacterium]
MKKRTIIDLFEESVEKYSDKTLLLEKIADKYLPTTYSQTKLMAEQFGAGLCSLGFQKNNHASIMSEGRNWWIIGELGIFYAGGINVPVSIKLEESSDLLFRFIHAEVDTILISERQLKKLRPIKDQLKDLKRVIVFDKLESYEPGEIFVGDLIEAGKEYLKKERESFLSISRSLNNDDYATITYTSGTTADPKGVILTHRNYTANVEQALSCMSIPPEKRMLIILPLDHCFAHVVGFYIMIATGSIVATVQAGKTGLDTLKNIPININEVKPNILLSVPALAKSFRKNIENSVKSKGKVAETLFNLGLETAYAYNKEGWNRGRGLSFLLYPFVKLFDKILFSKVKGAMGGELDFFVGGGALLDIEMQQFYYALGMPMFQGYGLSEATPVISTNTPLKHKLGSSGILVKPMEIKILDTEGRELPLGESGEIVIKGENVMAGYWKNPKSTQETIKDGWLYTGDLGYLDKDGFLYVKGRFKSLLISSDGEKFSPEGIEETIMGNSRLIQQIMLHNNQSPYTIAVIVADRTKLNGRELVEAISGELDKYKGKGEYAGQFPERWLPSTFVLADEPFTEQNRMINSTMKMVRSKVEEVYKERIAFAYTPEGKNIFNKYNTGQNE